MPTLGRYLSTIFDGNQENGQIRFKENPQLDRTRTNVILVFHGCFNPPHRGHLAVLWHAYHQLAKELNIVAAIIIPGPDEGLHDKYRHLGTETLVLPLKYRARLWNEDPHFPPWAWVFTEYTELPGGYGALEKNIKALASKDRCRVRFADLRGPDCGTQYSFREMTVISNIAREAIWDRQGLVEGFRPRGFGPWKVDVRLPSAGQTQEGHNLETPTTVLSSQLAGLSASRSVVICWQRRTPISPTKSVRFLRGTAEQYTPFRGISSSSIHGAIHLLKDRGDELRAYLSRVALSPDMLWDVLQSTWPEGNEPYEEEKPTDITCGKHERGVAFNALEPTWPPLEGEDEDWLHVFPNRQW
ncbi:MAG: hypothetical protein Q9221_008642 [Calogaya cf. arnoldii]